MIFNNSFIFFKKKIFSLYLNSSIYNKKINPTIISSLEYQPSPNFLDSLIKFEKKKINIENYSLGNIWNDKNLKDNAIFLKAKKSFILKQSFFSQSHEVIFRSLTKIIQLLEKKNYPVRGKSINKLISKNDYEKALIPITAYRLIKS